MDHGNMNDHGMDMMMMSPPPSSSSSSSSSPSSSHHHKMMMHMSFYWGTNAEILFHGWPGTHTYMYILSLILVFVLAIIVEWLSRSRLVKDSQNAVVSGIVLTLLHGLRMGLAYLVMLALMSFNAGVFIVAVLGHAVGFLVFGTRVFGSGNKNSEGYQKNPDRLPPMSC